MVRVSRVTEVELSVYVLYTNTGCRWEGGKIHPQYSISIVLPMHVSILESSMACQDLQPTDLPNQFLKAKLISTNFQYNLLVPCLAPSCGFTVWFRILPLSLPLVNMAAVQPSPIYYSLPYFT
jgi:hypothetical protein